MHHIYMTVSWLILLKSEIQSWRGERGSTCNWNQNVCHQSSCFFFFFFFDWQCGRGNLLSSSHKNELHKNAQEWATKERVPSQHGLMTLCLFAYIYLYNYAEVTYLQLNLAVRRMLHKASSKEKKERDPLWYLWPHQNEQPLVYPVNVAHFKDLC